MDVIWFNLYDLSRTHFPYFYLSNSLRPFSPQLSSITNVQHVLIGVIYLFVDATSTKMSPFSPRNSQGQNM